MHTCKKTQNKEQFLKFIEEAATSSLIDEVSATPKPGLVDLKDNGAHTDMDFHTFEASTHAIVPYITTMAKLGMDWQYEKEGLFLALRPIGVEAEKSMFAATKGVNTHKGMIFSMGLTAAAAGYSYQQSGVLQAANILELCREMCATPLEQDFAGISATEPKTHGERLFLQYGIRGIRGEAAKGFPAILRYSLPVLLKSSDLSAYNWNRICLQVLLNLMAKVDDTNVLYRTNYESLAYVRERADFIISLGGSFTEKGLQALEALNTDFIKRNISPGGCADLLAITLFLWRLEQFKEFH